MTDLLFAVPWWLPTMLAIIGISLLVSGNRRQKIGMRNAGVAVLCLAVGWALVSYLVDTDQEKVEKGTERMLQAVVDRQWPTFQSYLEPQTSFTIEGGSPRATSGKEIVAFASKGADFVNLQSAKLQNMEVTKTGTLISVSADVFSTEAFPGAPVMTSSWRFDWELTSQGWSCREIRMTKLHEFSGPQLEGMIPRWESP